MLLWTAAVKIFAESKLTVSEEWLKNVYIHCGQEKAS